jgi:hypothetical protein
MSSTTLLAVAALWGIDALLVASTYGRDAVSTNAALIISAILLVGGSILRNLEARQK